MIALGGQETLDLRAALAVAKADVAGWMHGIILQMADRAGHENFTGVAHVLDLSGFRLEGELKDVSSHLSGGWAERISVVKRGGRVTFLVRFDDMEAMLVVSAALEQSRELFRLVLEEEGVGFQFWAYVGVEFYAPEPGPVKIRVMLDITGPVSTL